TDGQLGDRAANPFDHSQAFVAGDQVVVPLWRHAIRSEVDVAIGAVETDTQHAHEYAPLIGNVRQARLRHIDQTSALRNARRHRDRAHHNTSCGASSALPPTRARDIAQAALIRPMWLNACGKLPSSSPVVGSTSSASSPTSLA